MASIMGVHQSTVARELRRNRGQRGYRPQQAQTSAGVRKQQQTRAAATHIDAAMWLQVES